MSEVNLFPWSDYLTPADRRAFTAGAGALVRAPSCPRCCDVEPGKPLDTCFKDPHPGPFRDDLCVPCQSVVDVEFNAERKAKS